MKCLYPGWAGLLIALLVAGCDLAGSDDTPKATSAPDLLPLAVGNEWIMESTLEKARTGQSSVSMDTIRVVSDTTIDGEGWYRVFDSGLHTEFYAANREDGLWYWTDPSESNSTPYLGYRHPVVQGDEYRRTVDELVQVLDVDTTITVEAGSFSTTHYLCSPERFVFGGVMYPNTVGGSEFYYAADTGLVKAKILFVSMADGQVELAGVMVRDLVRAYLQ